MKLTQKNMRGKFIMQQHAGRNPHPVSLTSTGKVHGGFGILAEFTTPDAAHETLRGLGYTPGEVRGSFTEYTKQA